MKLIGSEILIACLKEQGVDTVFGYPGGAVLDIYDALYRDGTIRHVITAHEQGAAHAADGYARATGKVGVCFATSGPGATNLVTGIATAYMDSVPMVAVTGNVGAAFLGRDSFQEVDITGVTMPITKHNFIVKDVKDLAGVVREAFYIANSGRKGPVLIDVLKNVQVSPCEYEPKTPVLPTYKVVSQEALTEAVAEIRSAARPLIMAGGGVVASGASAELIELAEKIKAPVACTLMGLGAMPASHPLYLGMIGMHGTANAAKMCLDSDCIIAIGTRFSDRVALNRDKFAENKKVVQIDIDEAEIGKNIAVTASVLGDVKETLKSLTPMLEKIDKRPYAERVGAIEPVGTDEEAELGRRIIQVASRLAPEGTVVATDVGQHQMWTAQAYPFQKPRTLLTSGGLGTMGYGFGAAIGGAFGTGKHVLLITGDGSFNMNLNELSTAVSNDLPITVLLMNNRALGMVRQWQKLFYGRRFSQTVVNKKTDYVKFAESFGAKGLRIEKWEDVEPVLKEAFSSNGPVVVDCMIGQDENVIPMIKPGQTYDTIMTKWEEK